MNRSALKILFKTDAGPEIGMGHLVRCCSIAAAMGSLAVCSCHFEPPFIDYVREILSTSGRQPRVKLPSGDGKHDIAVIDLPDRKPRAEEYLRSRHRLIVWIEDFPQDHLPSDVVIQPNILENDRAGSGGILHGGSKFIILHPDYQTADASVPGEPVRQVLLCFGGSDPANLSTRVTRLFQGMEGDVCYRLVLGPFYRDRKTAVLAASRVGDMTVLEKLPTLVDEMAACDLAILSGGTLLYEACAMGRPSVILSQNDSQACEASVFSDHGAVTHLGRHDLVANAEIVQAVCQLKKDPVGRRKQAEAAARFVPLDGAKRVCEHILRYYNS